MYTQAEWDVLPDNDKLDWLADDYRRREGITDILRSQVERVENELSIELTGYIVTLLALNE